jgi:nitrite reductase/ring-hydroxylating ferredoxin subunit
MSTHPSDQECTDCSIGGDRRDFLRSVGLAVGGLVAAGLLPKDASATSLTVIRALSRSGADVGYAIPAADGATIDKDNQVILVRTGGKVMAFNLSCPHQNTALKWIEEDKQFACPKHKSRYQPDGTFISGRATRNMDRLAIKKDGDKVMVNVDVMFKQDTDQAGWTAAVIAV